MNVSEGRDASVIAAMRVATGADLLDIHTDPHHHRTVLTLVGEDAPRRVATEAIHRLDLSAHSGAHPRLGVVDVVPFVPLPGAEMPDAVRARDDFGTWLAGEHDVPVFFYGPERSLPEIRRDAFRGLTPDVGPAAPHPTAGATCVGARPALIAYNLWLSGIDVGGARAIASAVRRPGLRALGLQVGDAVQVSLNLVAPFDLGPAEAYDLVAGHLTRAASIDRAELVGLLPLRALDAIDPDRWAQLDVGPERTVEARLAARPGS